MSITDGKWWDVSWNPIIVKGGGYHCEKISPGCLNCWAEQINLRFHNKIPYDNRPVEYEIDKKVLKKPLRWHKPRKVFACDMMDIFYEEVPYEIITEIFDIMNRQAAQHTYLILTKRAERMAQYLKEAWAGGEGWGLEDNLWLGVSAEDQWTADERIPLLLQIPAAHRFINFESLLEGIKFKADWFPSDCYKEVRKQIHWVAIGCESLGRRAGRHCDIKWVRDIIQQCKTFNVPIWIKQIAKNGRVSPYMSEWPKDLRIRQGLDVVK